MDQSEKVMPFIGELFPDMEVRTTHGLKRLPEAYTGKWLVLFSHPADFTPVCTTEFVAFQKRYADFREMNTELVGLSLDQVFSHIKWTEWMSENTGTEIEFPIIADDGTVAQQLGMVHPGKGSNTVRAVFIIDPSGIVRAILYYPQELGRNMDEILRMVKGLQVSDREGVAMPANWPNNELIGDSVILPPAADQKTAEARKEAISGKGKTPMDGFDWWFCHKKLEK